MPYDSVYSEKRPPGTLRTAGANFIVTPLRWSACTAARGWLYCVFLAAGSPYGIDQQFLGYQLLPPSWSRYGEVSSSWGLTTFGPCFKPFTERAARTVGGAFVVTLAATICGLVLGTFAGRRTAYAQRCLTIFWIPYWRSLRCCWQLSL